jgi:hypothetical protein
MNASPLQPNKVERQVAAGIFSLFADTPADREQLALELARVATTSPGTAIAIKALIFERKSRCN